MLAAVTSLTFSYLYETGRRTVWSPALVHTAIDSFKVFVIPAAALSTFPLLIILAGLLVPLLALAVPRRFLTVQGPEANEPTVSSNAGAVVAVRFGDGWSGR